MKKKTQKTFFAGVAAMPKLSAVTITKVEA